MKWEASGRKKGERKKTKSSSQQESQRDPHTATLALSDYRDDSGPQNRWFESGILQICSIKRLADLLRLSFVLLCVRSSVFGYGRSQQAERCWSCLTCPTRPLAGRCFPRWLDLLMWHSYIKRRPAVSNDLAWGPDLSGIESPIWLIHLPNLQLTALPVRLHISANSTEFSTHFVNKEAATASSFEKAQKKQ